MDLWPTNEMNGYNELNEQWFSLNILNIHYITPTDFPRLPGALVRLLNLALVVHGQVFPVTAALRAVSSHHTMSLYIF